MAQTQTNQVPEKTESSVVEVGNISVDYGRLRSITIRTSHLEFVYSYYEKDVMVALEIARKFDDDHRLTINAFVSPKAAENLMIAMFTTKYLTSGKIIDETREKWRHVFSVVDNLVSNVTEIGSIRMGDDLVKGKHGTMVTVGYERRGDMYYIFAEAEWREAGNYTCHVYEASQVSKDEVNRLSTFLETVLTLIDICRQ